MARKTAPTTVDHYGKHKMPLGIMEHFIPAPRNRDPLGLRVSMAWADRQVCPEHGIRWSHVRARWQRGPLAAGLGSERPAVMFRCPAGHVWEVVLTEHAPEGNEQ